jgi:hypothetical protein
VTEDSPWAKRRDLSVTCHKTVHAYCVRFFSVFQNRPFWHNFLVGAVITINTFLSACPSEAFCFSFGGLGLPCLLHRWLLIPYRNTTYSALFWIKICRSLLITRGQSISVNWSKPESGERRATSGLPKWLNAWLPLTRTLTLHTEVEVWEWVQCRRVAAHW